MDAYDVIVVGGGPGGYVAAIRAAQRGLKTAVVEKEVLGGTCLNWGCIPTKCLLHNAEVIHLLSKGKAFGFSFENLSVDYGSAQKRSRRVVSRLTKGVRLLMKNNEIAVYEGTAELTGADTLVIDPSGERLTARHIVIATGATPRQLPGAVFDGERVIHYRHALELAEVPSSVVVIGAGPIGMEFATIWNRYGSKVTVVEMLPHVLPLEDEDISIEAERQFKRAGIRIMTGSKVERIEQAAGGVDVTVAVDGGIEVLSAEKVLVAIGFAANCKHLGLAVAGVKTVNGNIDIDDRMRTNVASIYAVGDVTGKLGLAHAASAQGIVAAEAIAGNSVRPIDYDDIPRCTYSYPEVSSVGMTEKAASAKGMEVKTATYPFLSNGKALAMDDNKGFVKIVASGADRRVVGIHLVGAHVTELIAGPTGMITLKSSAEDLARTVFPHPTVGEAIMEAAHVLTGKGVHI
jgi:dihydrolipoamide dehydrogenase